MKLLSNIKFWIVALFLSGYAYLIGCTHDDQAVLQNGPVITRGNNVHLPGNLTALDTLSWKLDKVHSSVLWQTSYVGAAGLLTGRFNQFGMANVTSALATTYATSGQPLKDTSWAFYENDPSKTYFNGYVQINTSNTGEPGRDTGCNISGMGTVKIINGTQNLTTTNLAKIQTKSVKFDPSSNAYLVTLDLTWQGKLTEPLTKTLDGKLYYVPKKRVQFGTAAAYDVFGLQLVFQFNCRDFGIPSTSIADKIEIECNMNFNNK